MTLIPGAWISTIDNPARYTRQQLDLACTVAHALNRGQLILTDKPRG